MGNIIIGRSGEVRIFLIILMVKVIEIDVFV